MRTITIEHPEDVKALLDEELGKNPAGHYPLYDGRGWTAMHWLTARDWVDGKGATAAELLADLRAKIAAADPLDKLRKEAEAHGYALMKLPED